MNQPLVFGLFALYVAVASLYGILSGASDARLALVRKVWGRIHGLSIYFCVQVALPLLVGIVFVCWGAVNFNTPASEAARSARSDVVLKIDWQAIQKLKDAAQKSAEPDTAFTMPICA